MTTARPSALFVGTGRSVLTAATALARHDWRVDVMSRHTIPEILGAPAALTQVSLPTTRLWERELGLDLWSQDAPAATAVRLVLTNGADAPVEVVAPLPGQATAIDSRLIRARWLELLDQRDVPPGRVLVGDRHHAAALPAQLLHEQPLGEHLVLAVLPRDPHLALDPDPGGQGLHPELGGLRVPRALGADRGQRGLTAVTDAVGAVGPVEERLDPAQAGGGEPVLHGRHRAQDAPGEVLDHVLGVDPLPDRRRGQR